MFDESLKRLFAINGMDSKKVGLALEKDKSAHLWLRENVSLRETYGRNGVNNIYIVGIEEQPQMEDVSDMVEAVASVAASGDQATTGAGRTVANLAANFLRSEITAFTDANQGEIAEAPTSRVATDLENAEIAEELRDYLKRPLRISVYNYSASTTPWSVTKIYPWNLYMNSNAIRRKTANYSYFRGNLKVKFIVNCSPFYFGGIMIGYCPKNAFADKKDVQAVDSGAIILSQRQHILIEPQSNKGGEMTLPFFYEGKACPLNAVEQTNLGSLTIMPLTALRTSNGTAIPQIEIRIFAWLEDFELFGSSRYAQADIIGVAGNVADKNKLNDTHPLTLNNQLYPSVNKAFYNSPDIVETDMSYLIQKESLYLQIDIPMNKPPDERIVAIDTNPYCHREWSGTGGIFAVPNPMGYVAQLFRYWRGDLIYRFKFLCTKFHKGRVRITYDPVSGAVPNYEDSIFRSSHIVDLEESQDFEFVVPFITRYNWLNTRPMANRVITYTTSTSAVWDPNILFDSGVLQFTLDNSLTAPGVSDPITVLIYCRGADNLLLANPKALPDTLWMRAPLQPSGFAESSEEESKEDVHVFAQADVLDTAPKVKAEGDVVQAHAPDVCRDVLDICKRLAYFRTETWRDETPDDEAYIIHNTVSHNGVPWWRGPLTIDDYVVGSMVRTAFFSTFDQPVERVKLLPSVWMMGCYAAHVGSFTWFAKPLYSNLEPDYIAGARSQQGYRFYTTEISPVSNNNNFQDYYADAAYKNTIQGESLAGRFVQPYFKTNSPFYNFEKFYYCNTFSRDKGTAADTVGPLRGLQYQFRSGGVPQGDNQYHVGGIEEHVAAGEDWNLIYFISCPYVFLAPGDIPPPRL